jgi:hypothetical protein
MLPTSNVLLEIDVDNKRGRIVDNSDYASEDIVPSAVGARGLGIVTYGSGDTTQVVFNGSSTSNPLVNLATSTNGQWFNLPLDVNGNILNGTYSFTYNLRFAITAGVLDGITAPSTIQTEFYNAGTVLQAGDSVVMAGNGNIANNGTFTVASVTYDIDLDFTSIVVSQTTLVTDATPTGTYSFDVTRTAFAGDTYTYNGCLAVIPKVTTTFDCESTQFGQIVFEDTTALNGQTLVSRSLTGFYPNALNPAPPTESVTTTQPSLTFSELAVGTWTYRLILNMRVEQTDGLQYTYSTTDTDEVVVSCAGTLCGLMPCIQNLSNAFLQNYQNGTANNLIPILTQVNTLYNLAVEYKKCGEYEKYAATVAQLEVVLSESGECSCGCCDESKDVPYWVDNGNFDAQTVIDGLIADVTALQTTVASQITNIFTGRQFYGAQTGYTNAPISFSAISALAIPTGFLDFPTANGYGKKSIEIDIIAATGSSGANTQVRLTSGEIGTTVYSSTFGGDSGTQVTKLVLTIEKNGTDNNLWVATTTRTFDVDGSVITLVESNEKFANVITVGEDIVVNLTPVDLTAANKTTYTYVSILGKSNLI